jgi:hypothetical protein
LQRAITDFAADDPFAQVALKLREHYGFEIGESTIQRIALGHAKAIFESGRPALEFPQAAGRHKQIVAQIDGGMIPVVEPDADQKDQRKGKKLSWKEAKISLAHAKGSRTPIYSGGIDGGVEVAGRRLFDCAVRAKLAKVPSAQPMECQMRGASGRIRTCMRSVTGRRGSSARSRNGSVLRAAICLISIMFVSI